MEATVRGQTMSAKSVRWMMTGAGEPLVSMEFEIGALKVTPFVKKHPLNEINQVFEAVHAGALKRRPVSFPHS